MSELATFKALRAPAVSRFPAHSIAGLAGTSFKHQHLPAILAAGKQDGFFEVHAENYMGAGGPPHDALTRIRCDYPVSLHGVSMSIGGAQPLDKDHLRRFKALVDRYEPALVSEHLAWSTHDTTFFNDLLPLPYTPATLASVADHIDEVQETIGRPILLENPSTYVLFRAVDDERDGFHSRGGPAHRMWSVCSTSTTFSFRPPTMVTPRSPILPIFRLDMWARSIWPDIPRKRTTRAIFCSSTAMMARSRTRYGNSSIS